MFDRKCDRSELPHSDWLKQSHASKLCADYDELAAQSFTSKGNLFLILEIPSDCSHFLRPSFYESKTEMLLKDVAAKADSSHEDLVTLLQKTPRQKPWLKLSLRSNGQVPKNPRHSNRQKRTQAGRTRRSARFTTSSAGPPTWCNPRIRNALFWPPPICARLRIAPCLQKLPPVAFASVCEGAQHFRTLLRAVLWLLLGSTTAPRTLETTFCVLGWCKFYDANQ